MDINTVILKGALFVVREGILNPMMEKAQKLSRNFAEKISSLGTFFATQSKPSISLADRKELSKKIQDLNPQAPIVQQFAAGLIADIAQATDLELLRTGLFFDISKFDGYTSAIEKNYWLDVADEI